MEKVCFNNEIYLIFPDFETVAWYVQHLNQQKLKTLPLADQNIIEVVQKELKELVESKMLIIKY
jgi:hypothetical protein